MRDPAVDKRSSRARPFPLPDGTTQRRKLEPLELARWIETRAERLADRWLLDVRARHPRWDGDLEGLLSRFFNLLTTMLPATLGPFREEVEPLWVQASQLFGSVAAHRGLAVGEAVEEFQVFREVFIRALYAEPPAAGQYPIPLRELLRLNRIIDLGVTHAGVGHADGLFFALFQGSGVAEHMDAELTEEVNAQLGTIRDEFTAISGRAGG